MLIEGKKNLSFLKKALLSHLTYAVTKSMRADERKKTEYWDPEIKETEEWLDAVEKNLSQLEPEEIQANSPGSIQTGG
jgi:hypothetical protein